MLIAMVDNSRQRVMKKGQRGTCPQCGEVVIAKCGSVKAWHWAHKAKKECHWYAGELIAPEKS